MVIRQSFWLTGCEWAEWRSCCLSFLGERGYRRCLSLNRFGSREKTAPHAYGVFPVQNRNVMMIQLWSRSRRAQQKANGFDWKCLPAENLSTEYGRSRSIWHPAYFAELTRACSDASLPQCTQTSSSITLSKGWSKVSLELRQKAWQSFLIPEWHLDALVKLEVF